MQDLGHCFGYWNPTGAAKDQLPHEGCCMFNIKKGYSDIYGRVKKKRHVARSGKRGTVQISFVV